MAHARFPGKRLLLPVVGVALVLLSAPASFAQRVPTLEVRVTMPDGAELDTSVWLPGDSLVVALPTLLRRTPYGRALDDGFTMALNDLGYAVVSQDVRGRGGSDGDFLPFFPDRIDGPATIAWIAAQPWSNGRVGTWSGSAEGIVQFMALGEGPPALDCAFVTMATEDVCAGMMPGGAWRTELTTAWMNGMGAQDALAQWRQHEACDAWWDAARLSDDEVAQVRAPVLMIGGFFDIFPSDMVRAFQRFRNRADLAVRDDMFLVLGPWTHGTLMADDSGMMPEGELTYPPDAGYTDYWGDFIEFFAWCLQDAPRPAWAPVRYFQSRIASDGVTTNGTWWTSRSWPPPPGVGPRTVFLGPDNGLWQSLPGDPPPPIDIPVDPASPVPSIGGGNLTTPAGPRDQALLDQLPGVAVFETPPVDIGSLFEGNVTATLWASNTTDDVDVVVRLSQVTPGGRVLLLADGIRRGRYANGTDRRAPLSPDVPTRFDIELGPVAFYLPAAHQLRVSVAGTSSPRYEPNPGTWAAIVDAPAPVLSTLSIHLGGDTASTINLPLRSDFLHLHRSPDSPEPVPDAAMPDAGESDAAGDAATGDPGSACPDCPGCPQADLVRSPCPKSSGCVAGGGPGAFSVPAAILALLAVLAFLGRLGTRRRNDPSLQALSFDETASSPTLATGHDIAARSEEIAPGPLRLPVPQPPAGADIEGSAQTPHAVGIRSVREPVPWIAGR